MALAVIGVMSEGLSGPNSMFGVAPYMGAYGLVGAGFTGPWAFGSSPLIPTGPGP